MEGLPTEVLQHVGSFLPFTERRTTFPLVCKALAAAAHANALGDLWADVSIVQPPQPQGSKADPEEGACFEGAALLPWLGPRAMQVERVFVDCRALQPQGDALADLLRLFRASPRLKALRIMCSALGSPGSPASAALGKGMSSAGTAACLPLIQSLGQLQSLSLQEVDGFYNHGFTLQALTVLTSLRHLSISLREGLIMSWPNITSLKGLQTLELRGCPAYGQPWTTWAPLPESLRSLTGLHTLTVSCARYTEIPEVVTKLTHLTRLSFDDNCFSGSAPSVAAAGWPLAAAQLPSKRQLPAGFDCLVNLKSLSLGTWSGGAIPSAICDLTNLEELNLQGEIPYDFDDGFDVDDEDSPAAAALHAFALPERFACLKRLRILRLDGHAGMTHLPIQVLKLPQLELLDLSNTGLSHLPMEMIELESLHTLLLGACQFTQVPVVVFHLDTLRTLDLSRNPGLDLGGLSEGQLGFLAGLHVLRLDKPGNCF